MRPSMRRGAGRMDLVQFHADLPPELRVHPKDVDGELHLVGDSLAGTVATRKEFEIAWQIVLPISIFMVDSFVWMKFASEYLLHHIAMFESVSRGFSANSRNDHSNVAVFDDSRCGLLVRVPRLVRETTKK